MTNRIDELDLDDPEVYDLVRKTNKSKKNEQQPQDQELNQDQTNDNTITNYIIDETPIKNTNTNTTFDFIKKLLVICVCIFLIYLFIYRYMIGFDFLKNKQYTRSMAVMSPELLTLSSFLL